MLGSTVMAPAPAPARSSKSSRPPRDRLVHFLPVEKMYWPCIISSRRPVNRVTGLLPLGLPGPAAPTTTT